VTSCTKLRWPTGSAPGPCSAALWVSSAWQAGCRSRERNSCGGQGFGGRGGVRAPVHAGQQKHVAAGAKGRAPARMGLRLNLPNLKFVQRGRCSTTHAGCARGAALLAGLTAVQRPSHLHLRVPPARRRVPPPDREPRRLVQRAAPQRRQLRQHDALRRDARVWAAGWGVVV
jgi:hypothetical protein